jgi:ferric-dicitrate binding protein FerR (iron transport regulator)
MERREVCDCGDACKVVLATEEAAEWYLRLQDRDLPLGKRISYICWLKTSPAHIAEMFRMWRLRSWLRRIRL